MLVWNHIKYIEYCTLISDYEPMNYSKASVSAFFGTKTNPALTKNALIEAYVIKGWDQKFPKTALF